MRLSARRSVSTWQNISFLPTQKCDPDYLLSQGTTRKYVTWLEEGDIGPSGIIGKLRRIDLAINCLGHQHEDRDSEVEFWGKRDLAVTLLASIRTSLSKDKRKAQVTKLDEFSHSQPELGEVSDFISSRTVQTFLEEAHSKALAGQEVPNETLQECMYLINGRLMLW